MSEEHSREFRRTRSMGPEKFNQRREMFDQPASPTTARLSSPVSTAKRIPPEVKSVFEKDGAVLRSVENKPHFARTPAYSSMREPRSTDHNNWKERTVSSGEDDQIEYRMKFMSDRTRRLTKLRSDFLKSSIENSNSDPFKRNNNLRCSLPASSAQKKIDFKPYKFPFAEPFATPQPTRKEFQIDETDSNGKETVKRHLSVTYDPGSLAIDPKRVYKELMERYSPPRKEVNWDFPPTPPPKNLVIAPTPTLETSQENTVSLTDSGTVTSNNDLAKLGVVNAVQKPPRRVVSQQETPLMEVLEKISTEQKPPVQTNGNMGAKKQKSKRSFFARLFRKNKNK